MRSELWRRMRMSFERRRRRPRSRLYRVTNWAVAVLGIAYLLLIFNPNLLFAHSLRIGPFDIHSDRPIAKQVRDVAANAERRLAASPLYADDQRFEIFIAEDDWRRWLLNPRGAKAFGAHIIFTGKIILNRCDIEANRIFNDRPLYNVRPLHSVIAHECTHRMIRERLGLLGALRLPTWKDEGYCEYVSGDPSFDTERAIEMLADGQAHDSPAFRYACWLLAVRHLLDEREVSVNDFFADDLNYEEELRAAVQLVREG